MESQQRLATALKPIVADYPKHIGSNERERTHHCVESDVFHHSHFLLALFEVFPAAKVGFAGTDGFTVNRLALPNVPRLMTEVHPCA